MKNSAPHIAIYGAVADIPPQLGRPLPRLARIKRSVKARRDISRFRRNAGFRCDYRDYEVGHASNIGDVAIAETIRRELRSLHPDCVFSNIDWGNIGQLKERHARHKIDLLVVAGGGYFLFDHAGHLPDRLGADLAVLQTTGIPYVFWGVGVNQPYHPLNGICQPRPTAADEARLKTLLDGAMLITVRDEYSATYLAGYTQQQVHLVGDPALHVAAALEPSAAGTSDDTPVVGLNLSFHGPSSNRFLLDNLPAYARSLKAIQRESGCRFRYITHHACEYIVPRLLRAAGIPLEIVHADLVGTCKAYRDIDLHIGGMLHSCILAASAGTPWIAIAYDIKHQGFNQLMGVEGHYQDALNFSESALLALALESLHNRDALRARIAARRDELRERIAQVTHGAIAQLRMK
ncbi:MAG: polysaccharide pyruvyl transferase family protein [Rhodocyclaceae bacterium]|nr:polysaccharide pyruvyl transferase family protein [Rhodocyclaceae bacterium]